MVEKVSSQYPWTIFKDPLKIPCRLCLTETKEPNTVPVTKFTKDVAEVLLLKLNLDVSINPVLCEVCSKKLKKFFDFKCTCLYTEDSIAPYIESNQNGTVNLLDLCVQQSKDQTSTNTFGERKLCRLCIQFTLNGYISLSAVNKDSSFVIKFIQEHLPEVNLSVIKDPIICYVCCRSIVAHSRFVNDCLAVERQIEDFCKTRGSDDNTPILLYDVNKYVKSKNCEAERGKNNTDKVSNTNKKEDNKEKKTVLKKCVRTESAVIQYVEAKLGVKAKEMPPLSIVPVCKSCKGKVMYGADYQDVPLDNNVTLSLLGCKDCTDVEDITQLLHKSIITYGYIYSNAFYCRLCGMKLAYKIAYKMHILRHKYRMRALYKCNLCQFATNVHTIHNHMKQHRVLGKCDYCVFTTSFSKGLLKHMSDHVLNSTD